MDIFPASKNSSSAQDDLGDSHFQLPIRRPKKRPSNIKVIAERHQSPADVIDLCIIAVSDDGWEAVPRPDAESTKDKSKMISINDRKDITANETRERPIEDFSLLYKAILEGDMSTIKSHISLGVSLHQEDDEGFTLLCLAIRARQVEVVRFLLEQGANVHQRVESLLPIVHALRCKDEAPEFIQLLLDFGANPNMRSGTEQYNALHFAATEGLVDAVDFLATKDMDLDERCSHQRTPLILAAQRGYLLVVKVLIAKGADFHARSWNGGTALMWAACNGHVDIVRFFVDQGLDFDINDCDYTGLSALSVLSSYGSLEGVRLILERGADINLASQEPKDFTPVMAAAMCGHTTVVETLIEHDADLRVVNSNNDTALSLALAEGRLETVLVLLKALGGPNHPQNSVALQLAMSNSHATTKSLITTILLMFSSLSANSKEASNLTWLAWVFITGGEYIKPYALKNMMHAALHDENLNLVSDLLSHGYDPNQHLASGDTPLTFAVDRHNFGLVSTLLDAGADPSLQARYPEKHRRTPLHSALLVLDLDPDKDTSIVDLLLSSKRCKLMKGKDLESTAFYHIITCCTDWNHGAAEILIFRMLQSVQNINDDRADDGSTLMHAAVQQGKKDLIDILSDRGADIDAKDNQGRTPFLRCADGADMFHDKPRNDMLQFLISRGADPFATSTDGLGALHAAASHGSITGIDFFIKLGLSIESVTDQGQTPLICATMLDEEKAALHLLDCGANASMKVAGNQATLLHLAADGGMARLVARLLQDKSVDINAKSMGRTALTLASQHQDHKIAHEIVTMLLEAGADKEIPDNNGDRPLHVALLSNNDPTAHLLIQRGANTTVRSSRGNSLPLHHAVDYSCPTAAALLIARADDSLDATDSAGQTPLLLSHDVHMTETLIQHGANVNFADGNGWTALHRAVDTYQVELFEVLLAAGADLEAKTLREGFGKKDGLSVRERIEYLEDRALQAAFWHVILQSGPEVLSKISSDEQARMRREWEKYVVV